MIKIFNSMSREKEVFNPIVPGQVKMYVCGVTVYDHSHMGHGRSAIVFDTIARYLRFRGFEVTLVKNFTDIDDKIIKRSSEENIAWEILTQKYINEYHHDMGLLKVLAPTFEPKATDYINEMLKLIQVLMEKGFAYLSGGDVYYRIEAFKNYGKLSKRDLSVESAGIRIEVSDLKENPLDFVLWKSSKPGEPWWSSPWGKGRPGWHIECSAMAMRLLGETIDIHGGGEDLLFPHHENEIAQSESVSGRKFANYWIHNGFVTVNQEKMSKSLGNFFTIKEVFEKYGYLPEVMGEMLRYFMLSTHYRQPIQFSDQAIDEAKRALDRFYDLLKKCNEASSSPGKGMKENLDKILSAGREKFKESMDDDFNTPEAIASFHSTRSEINRLYKDSMNSDDSKEILQYFKDLGEPLGLFSVPSKTWQFGLKPRRGVIHDKSQISNEVARENLRKEGHDVHAPLAPDSGALSEDQIEGLIRDRSDSKRKGDFKTADQIREYLKMHGITLEDSPNGKTSWKR